MTNAIPNRPMTAEELAALPDDGNRYELSSGRIVRMSPSGIRSNSVGGNVYAEVRAFVKRTGAGACGPAEGGFRLTADPDTVRSPDAWFVRAEHVPAAGIPDTYWIGAPDLAVEVRSPTDRWSDLLRKVAEYFEAGTTLVWVLDPRKRSAIVFRADGSIQLFGEDGVLDGEDVLPGFKLHLIDIWE